TKSEFIDMTVNLYMQSVMLHITSSVSPLEMSRPPSVPLVPYTTLFRSGVAGRGQARLPVARRVDVRGAVRRDRRGPAAHLAHPGDRKSTRLNSSHGSISYAVFCLKKKNIRVSNASNRNIVNISDRVSSA